MLFTLYQFPDCLTDDDRGEIVLNREKYTFPVEPILIGEVEERSINYAAYSLLQTAKKEVESRYGETIEAGYVLPKDSFLNRISDKGFSYAIQAEVFDQKTRKRHVIPFGITK